MALNATFSRKQGTQLSENSCAGYQDMKLCPTSRRKQQENTFLMKHISETNERQFHCIKACFQGKLNRIYPFYKAATIQSKAFHLTCKDVGYQHPLAPAMQLSILTCRTQTDLCQCRNIFSRIHRLSTTLDETCCA